MFIAFIICFVFSFPNPDPSFQDPFCNSSNSGIESIHNGCTETTNSVSRGVDFPPFRIQSLKITTGQILCNPQVV